MYNDFGGQLRDCILLIDAGGICNLIYINIII